jgi:predicted nucleic acid-binding protein
VIVLDTNVVSELVRPSPNRSVVEWVDEHDSSELVLTALTAAELRAGVALLPVGRRGDELGMRIESLLVETFAGYVLAFDVGSSAYYAEVLAVRTRGGRPITTFDAQIAAVCRQYDSVLATRNTTDFTDTGIQLVNPWDPTI